MNDLRNEILRALPSVDELMGWPGLAPLGEEFDRAVIVNAVRTVLDETRSEIVTEGTSSIGREDVTVDKIGERIVSLLRSRCSPSLRRAINATGVILHTGLGRAVLAQKAVDAINDAIRGYCTLATDIETGRRGERDVHLNGLLCELTGAEAATVVNNNAAATMLILNTMAKGKEVIVSRGQLVEIGGSFRIPEVMEQSGAVLREVGTTNKTHLRDYSSAINDNTAAILRVHQSNYRIVGFTEEPSIKELVELAKGHNLPVIDDLGSGALVDLGQFGLEPEPMVQESVGAGADVVCFSGDKLIGGPQSGVIVGKAASIERIRKNPLARAVRVGKMTIAAMEATLRLFLNRAKLCQQHPTYRMFSLTVDELEKRAQTVVAKLRDLIPGEVEMRVVDGGSEVGSGSAPIQTMPTRLLSVRPTRLSAEELAKQLRHNDPPIFARIQREAVLLDLRTIQPDEDTLVGQALGRILGKQES